MQINYASTIRARFDAELLVAITAPGGATIFDQRFGETLRPEIPAQRALQFALPMAISYGAFKVWAEISAGGKRIAYYEVYFTPVLQGRLEGRLLDAVTGAPIPGAQVRRDGGQPVAPTPDIGGFSFTTTAGGHWVYATAPATTRREPTLLSSLSGRPASSTCTFRRRPAGSRGSC